MRIYITIHPITTAIRKGITLLTACLVGFKETAADLRDSVVNTDWKLMELELKQFSRVTSATSSGSANSISTH